MSRYDARMSTAAQRQRFETWLKELTATPTAAGREQRVVRWIQKWVNGRKGLTFGYDKARNVVITQERERKAKKPHPPLYITAHLDHPAFVVSRVVDHRHVEMEFRGGVMDPYFENAAIEIFDDHDRVHRARIIWLDNKAQPFKLVRAELAQRSDTLRLGDVGRWRFAGAANTPRVIKGQLHTHACDDLAAVAAGLGAMDLIRKREGCEHVRLLFTRAEEIGFIGAIAAARSRTLPRKARLLCLENSRSFAESPIGGGPILRVGDKVSVFEPHLTNTISLLLEEHTRKNPKFRYQRRLMPGGTCEATTFSSYGYQSTCICLPLGNYHNMRDIDGVNAGKRPAKVAPEHIALADYHGMVDMLDLIARKLDGDDAPSIRGRMEKLYKECGFVLR